MAELPDEILAFLTKLRLVLLAVAVLLVLLTSWQWLAILLATLALSLRVFAQMNWFQKLMLRWFKKPDA